MKGGNETLAACGTTIFEVMSGLARRHGAVNLGQGFPDEDGPKALRERAARALLEGPNQYPSMMGLPELRDAVARHGERFYGLSVDAETDVMVTSGATEALACCFLGLLNPGDEVVVFEPTYDSYRPMIELAGARARAVKLSPPDWSIDEAELVAAFSDKTKLCVLNSPMNPTGKVFSTDELDLIAREIRRADAIAVCDEVYEHISFGAPHVPLMTREGMRERSVRIGSAGKTFSLTGWKIGYITGAKELMMPISRAHQFLNFTTPPCLQLAVADGLAMGDEYFAGLSQDMARKRDHLAEGLRDLGFGVAACDGTYFLGADYSPLGIDGPDHEVCRKLVEHAGVATVPYSAFYEGGRGPSTWLRFAFCKRMTVLDDALLRLRKYLKK